MRVASLVAACWLAGCTSAGLLDLALSLPNADELRPTGMTTITVLASSAEMAPIANTSVIDGDTFSAGDFPIGKNVEIDVLLHDDSNRLVGVGQAPHLIDIVGDRATSLTIPVRRPFVYASSGSTLYTFDPTLDPRDAGFQGKLSGVSAPRLAISVGGDRLVVASESALQVVDTATNTLIGPAIAIPGTINDAAPVPGTHQIAVAHSAGISIVDLDSGAVASAATPPVDRITVGPDVDGGMIADGLVGRIAPPTGPVDACAGTSSIVEVTVAAPADAQAMALDKAVSDIATSADATTLYATLPCEGQIAQLDGTTFTNVAPLERAAVLAVAGNRVWAAGAHASTPVCANGSCAQGAQPSCPQQVSGMIGYVDQGAHLILASIPLEGGTATDIDLPERRETMLSTDDPAGVAAQVLRPLSARPLDLVALPGGQYLALVVASEYYTTARVESTGFGDEIVLPCLDATTGDWMLIDTASTSIAERVRTQCDLTVGPSDSIFQGFACEDPPAGEQVQGMGYQPISVGALFGAR
jgi:hypothetical protein